MFRVAGFQRFGILCFLISISLFFSVLSPYFLTLENLRNILVQSSVSIIAAAGMTIVIGTAGIDLSVGSILGFISVFGASQILNYGILPGIFLSLLVAFPPLRF